MASGDPGGYNPESRTPGVDRFDGIMTRYKKAGRSAPWPRS
ncbi:MAG TPA: hypothetical protein PLO37_21845 [Candidatus Hydrogenedentes bacterium]|nr:hypothetical protein [Candidatus Hydrogenedentota bacterium]